MALDTRLQQIAVVLSESVCVLYVVVAECLLLCYIYVLMQRATLPVLLAPPMLRALVLVVMRCYRKFTSALRRAVHIPYPTVPHPTCGIRRPCSNFGSYCMSGVLGQASSRLLRSTCPKHPQKIFNRDDQFSICVLTSRALLGEFRLRCDWDSQLGSYLVVACFQIDRVVLL